MLAYLPRTLSLLAGMLFISHTTYSQTCYFPNGDVAEGMGTCTDGDGPCCPYQWYCVSNGLCYLGGFGYYGRYTCTDPSWDSDSCPQICTQEKTAGGNEAVLQCSDGSWCCDGDRSFDCCSNNNTEFFSLPEGTVVAYISSTVPGISVKSSTPTQKPLPTSDINSLSIASTSFSIDSTSTSPSATTRTSLETTTNSAGNSDTITILRAPSNTPAPPTANSHQQSHDLALIISLPTALAFSVALLGILIYRHRNKHHPRHPSTTNPIDPPSLLDLSSRVHCSNEDNPSSGTNAPIPLEQGQTPRQQGPFELESPFVPQTSSSSIRPSSILHPPSVNTSSSFFTRSPDFARGSQRWSELEGTPVSSSGRGFVSSNVEGGDGGRNRDNTVFGGGSEGGPLESAVREQQDQDRHHDHQDGVAARQQADVRAAASSPQELWGGYVAYRSPMGEADGEAR